MGIVPASVGPLLLALPCVVACIAPSSAPSPEPSSPGCGSEQETARAQWGRLAPWRPLPTRPESGRASLERHAGPSGEGEHVQARKNDPRIALVGRVLRRFSVDELPRLIDVPARGMSLVGPRAPILDADRDVEARCVSGPARSRASRVPGSRREARQAVPRASRNTGRRRRRRSVEGSRAIGDRCRRQQKRAHPGRGCPQDSDSHRCSRLLPQTPRASRAARRRR